MDMTRVRVVKWIPTQEELPGKNKNYLVTVKYDGIEPFITTKYFLHDTKGVSQSALESYKYAQGHFVGFDEDGLPYINSSESNITAWAELPRPF